MRYFYIDEEFSEELIHRFIAFVNDTNDNIVIYLDSIGGDYSIAVTMADLINRTPERFEMVVVSRIYSAAFWLFFSVDCKHKILPNAIGGYHLAGLEVRVKSNGGITGEIQSFQVQQLKNELEEDLFFCASIKMTKAEISRFKSGKDVFFSNERLRELLHGTWGV